MTVNGNGSYFGADRRKAAEASANHQNWWVLPGFAVLVEAVFVVALVMSYFGEDKTLLNVMCTAAVAQAGVVANFLFGNSQGAVRKDEALAATSIKQNETIAALGAASASSVPAGVVTATLNPGPPPSVDITSKPAEAPLDQPTEEKKP